MVIKSDDNEIVATETMQAVLGMILRLPLGADSCKSSINHTSSSLEANLDIYLNILLSLFFLASPVCSSPGFSTNFRHRPHFAFAPNHCS
eukprot:scaffold7665_cov135-Skeletonema_dohrnii-CCMP3373.AAC.5